ncbi:hypothetical protein [Pontiella desulfatans]|nr:hypothetical protein [Pontiella desulfatans]
MAFLCYGVCSSLAEDISADTGKLRWMGHWKGEGGREQMVREVLDEFRFLHPKLDVEFQFASDVLPEKSQLSAANCIVEMIRSGTFDWDVVWLDPLIYSMVADQLDDWDWGRKHLVDFCAVPGFGKTQKNFLVEGKDAHRYTAGVFPGPYIEGFLYTAWYNQSVADRLGLDIREEGMTEKDLLGYVEKVHAYNQTAAEPIAAFLDVARSGSFRRLYYGLLYSCLPECDSEGEADGPTIAEAYARTDAFFGELGRYQPTEGNAASVTWPDAARFMLVENRALFFFDATWRYNAFKTACPERIGQLRLAQMPGFGGNSHAVGGYLTTWAVLKNAPGRDAGIELMRHWSRPPIAQKWVRYTKCPTGLKGDLYDPTFGQDIHAEFQRRLRLKCNNLMADPPVFSSRFVEQYPSIDPERAAVAVLKLRGDEGGE